jgi:hypothetical protein
MKTTRILAALVALALATPAFAGCTVGTTSAVCVKPGAWNHVLIQNTSTTAAVACAWNVPAVLNGASSLQLAPGARWLWGGPDTAGVPQGTLNCIASAAATLYSESN